MGKGNAGQRKSRNRIEPEKAEQNKKRWDEKGKKMEEKIERKTEKNTEKNMEGERKRRKVCRYFAGFLKRQEDWLNRMAKRGWHLVKAGRLIYEFEPCEPGAYEYRIEFAGHLGWSKSKDYRAFLQEMGYEIFYKNLNLSWSLGKVRWRPYGSGTGQIATSPGVYNRELMIVGRQANGKPFELHTTNEDRAAYMAVLRRVWLCMSALFLALCVCSLSREGLSVRTVLFLLTGGASLIPAWLYHWRVREYRKQAEE